MGEGWILEWYVRKTRERSANSAPAKKQNELRNSSERKRYRAVKIRIHLRLNFVYDAVTVNTRNTNSDPRIS